MEGSGSTYSIHSVGLSLSLDVESSVDFPIVVSSGPGFDSGTSDVAPTKSLAFSLEVTLSSSPSMAPAPSVLGEGEATALVDCSWAALSSSKANQFEFVKSDPLKQNIQQNKH